MHEVNVVFIEVIDVVMQPPTFFAIQCTANNQFGDCGDVAKLDEV
jgi:hypothetical protein